MRTCIVTEDTAGNRHVSVFEEGQTAAVEHRVERLSQDDFVWRPVRRMLFGKSAPVLTVPECEVLR